MKTEEGSLSKRKAEEEDVKTAKRKRKSERQLEPEEVNLSKRKTDEEEVKTAKRMRKSERQIKPEEGSLSKRKTDEGVEQENSRTRVRPKRGGDDQKVVAPVASPVPSADEADKCSDVDSTNST